MKKTLTIMGALVALLVAASVVTIVSYAQDVKEQNNTDTVEITTAEEEQTMLPKENQNSEEHAEKTQNFAGKDYEKIMQEMIELGIEQGFYDGLYWHGFDPDRKDLPTHEELAKITYDMTYSEVESIIGAPQRPSFVYSPFSKYTSVAAVVPCVLYNSCDGYVLVIYFAEDYENPDAKETSVLTYRLLSKEENVKRETQLRSDSRFVGHFALINE